MTNAVYQISAFNYAFDSENKIHSDDVASNYGFEGGLVPGVADFAYLLRAAHAAWGAEWLHHGTIEARFLKPVYHRQIVSATARADEADDGALVLELVNRENVVCAVGRATRTPSDPAPTVDAFPACSGPVTRADPSVAGCPAGMALGDYEYDYVAQAAYIEATQRFAEPFSDKQDRPLWHPATCLHDANRCLRASVALGPWIHTGSAMQLYGAPADGERISLRGRVRETFVKNGHTRTTLDLAWFADERGVARIRHDAIIALAGISG
tara:strand:- start:2178 stop:2981 length:804 start_codon:yes stop_codon:yes gene_type:complete